MQTHSKEQPTRSLGRRGLLALGISIVTTGCTGFFEDESDPLEDVDETDPESVAAAVGVAVYTWDVDALEQFTHQNSSAAEDAVEEVEEFVELLSEDAVDSHWADIQSTTILSETSEEVVVDVVVESGQDTDALTDADEDPGIDLTEINTLTVVLRPAPDDAERWRLWDTGVR